MAWDEVIHDKEAFTLAKKVNEQQLFSAMFGYAIKIREPGSYDAEAARQYVRETIGVFIVRN